jgi:hypothetical protein
VVKRFIWRIIQALYWLACVGGWVYFIPGSGNPDPGRKLTAASNWLDSLTDDPALKFILQTIGVIVWIALIPGIVVIGIGLLIAIGVLGTAAAVVLSWLTIVCQLWIWSPTGKVLAVIVALLGLYLFARLGAWFAKKYELKKSLWRICGPALTAIYAIFFDWWLTPLVMRSTTQGYSIATVRRGRFMRRTGIVMTAAGCAILIVALRGPAWAASSALVKRINSEVPPADILPAPAIVVPPDGAVFDHFPRTTLLQWKAVPGAASYTIQVDAFDPQTCRGCRLQPGWVSERDHVTYILKPGIRETWFTFAFAGKQPGRWRVTAVDGRGRRGITSRWWGFRYTK